MTFTSKVNKRARPLLGTVVEIGVSDLEAAEAQELISESFLKIEHIERAMSRFDKQSEVSQIDVHDSLPCVFLPCVFECEERSQPRV